MINILSKISSILASLATLLIFQSSPPKVQTVPISPTSSSSQSVITSTPTTDLQAIILQVNDLQKSIAAITPEPTPTPEIIYIQGPVNPIIPTPQPSTIVTPSFSFVNSPFIVASTSQNYVVGQKISGYSGGINSGEGSHNLKFICDGAEIDGTTFIDMNTIYAHAVHGKSCQWNFDDQLYSIPIN